MFYLLLFLCFLVVAVLISWFRIAYPYHRHLAFLLFLGSLTVGGMWLMRQPVFLTLIQDRLLLSLVGLALLFYFLWTIFPFAKGPFLKKNRQELEVEVTLGIKKLDYLQKMIQQHNQQLIEFYTTQIKPQELEMGKIKTFKNLYLLFLESFSQMQELTDRFHFFYQIHIIKYPELNFRAFLIAYTAFISSYDLIFQLSKSLPSSAENYLNENLPRFGPDTYHQLKKSLNHPEWVIKMNSGMLYLFYGKKKKKLLKSLSGEEKEWLSYCQKTYGKLLKSFGHYLRLSAEIPLDSFEKHSARAVIPLQKKIAKGLAQTRLSFKGGYSIPHRQLRKTHRILEPGDILLQRRNFHLSNLGIEGFWKHSALYVGTLKRLDEYFLEASKELLGLKVSDYLKKNHPDLYALKRKKQGKYLLSTLEGKAEGVVMLSLEESAHADSVAALRPNLSKQDKLKALLLAFEQFGKPYDYNFDFATSDSLVCSELVYKSYFAAENKNGLHYDLSLKAGRLMFTPNDIAEHFDAHYESVNRQMEFVLYWEGKSAGKAIQKKNVKDFRASWQRRRVDFI